MQKLSILELDVVSGGGHILVVTAPGHYVADHGHIDIAGRDIVTNLGHIDITTGGGLGDICN